jgi:hypothetical protein
MKHTQASWEEKRKNGFLRFLIVDGILFTGGPFAFALQFVGLFFLRDEGQSIGQYFSSSRMWTTFFLHATLFGGIMGLIYWFRNEKNFPAKTDNS